LTAIGNAYREECRQQPRTEGSSGQSGKTILKIGFVRVPRPDGFCHPFASLDIPYVYKRIEADPAAAIADTTGFTVKKIL
jgi:hypothetical protein